MRVVRADCTLCGCVGERDSTVQKELCDVWTCRSCRSTKNIIPTFRNFCEEMKSLRSAGIKLSAANHANHL